MKVIGKIFLYLVILLVGFYIGISWNSIELLRIDDSSKIVESGEVTQGNDNSSQGLNATSTATILPSGGISSEMSTISIFENAAPSVCFINTSNLEMNYWTRDVMEIPRGSGSGFIWDKEGHIVTNYHVIKGADKAMVTLSDQRTYKADVVGIAPDKDLAVLRINFIGEELSPLPLGNSENLKVGQSVFAIGNPFGLDHTLTTGIISALGREINSQSSIPIRDVIQTDAAINPGNSGGPLLDSSGKLIGVNTAIYSPSGAYAGIGFSIPVDVIKYAVPDLIQFGAIKRPVLGVELLTNPQMVKRLNIKGALVVNVTKGGGAEEVGIIGTRRDRNGDISWGDIIIGINEEKIESNSDLVYALEKFKAGDMVRVKLLRKNELIEKEIELGSN